MLFSGRRRIREVAKGYGFQHFLTVEGKVTACGALPRSSCFATHYVRVSVSAAMHSDL